MINVHTFKRKFSKFKAFRLCFLNGAIVILIPFPASLSKQRNVNSNSHSFPVYSHSFHLLFIPIFFLIENKNFNR